MTGSCTGCQISSKVVCGPRQAVTWVTVVLAPRGTMWRIPAPPASIGAAPTGVATGSVPLGDKHAWFVSNR